MADFGKLNFSVSFNPTSAFPLDDRYYFDTFEAASVAASSAVEVGSAESTYFIGQNVVVVEGSNATLYIIQPDKTLKPVGTTPVGDNKTITVSPEGTISLVGIADAQKGAYPSKKADGSIEWVKPDTTTVEGLTQTVEALDNRVETIESTLGNEGSGLVQKVNTIEENLSSNYYNKSEIDGKISGVFRFKGTATKYEDGNLYNEDELIVGKSGDVYQVDDKEYAYNGTSWVELGFTIDLSNYATTSWTTQQINAAKTELKEYADQAEADAINSSKSYTDSKVEVLATNTSVTEAINAAKTELKEYADQAEADAINSANTNTDSKIKAAIGTLGDEYSNVKQYIDSKDSALDGKISALNGKFDGLGTLASLNEVGESNLAVALKSKIDNKADKASTLAGYGITDTMTLTQITDAISTAKTEAINEAGTAADSKISAKIGTISGTVKDYVDGKEGTINSSIEAIQSTIDGYGDIVTHNVSEFETAGAAAAVLGTEGDLSTANTVYGAKKGVEEAKAAAQAAQEAAATASSKADSKVANIKAADNSVTIGGTTTSPTISVKIDPDENNAISVGSAGLKVQIDSMPEYLIEKETTATEGYLASYVLKKNGVQSGVKIDIPKDYLVKSASIKESIGDGDPSGLPEDTKYIDFVINTKDTSGQESHIYLNVGELVDTYTAGNGISISPENQISAKIVVANGLSIDASGIKLNTATSSVAGAMSSTDKSKLDGIEPNAQTNIVETISINGEKLVPSGKDIAIPLASATRLGVVKADNISLAVADDGTISVKSVNVNLLTQSAEDVLILDCAI